jgi:hypothetical protein
MEWKQTSIGHIQSFYRIYIIEDERNDIFSSYIAPLLNSPTLKVLHVSWNPYNFGSTIGNLKVIRDAFQSNQSLEELHICDNLYMQNADQLDLFLQGIASAPNYAHLVSTFLVRH